MDGVYLNRRNVPNPTSVDLPKVFLHQASLGIKEIRRKFPFGDSGFDDSIRHQQKLHVYPK
jgi:hypothetical protein